MTEIYKLGKQWKVIRFVLPGLLFIWILITSVFTDSRVKQEISAPQKGFIAPEIELSSLDENIISLSSLRGKVVIVNLWASWCPPCVSEMNAIQSVYEDYKDKGLVVLAVNMTFQDQYSDAVNFITENEFSFPVLFDFAGEIAQKYKMLALPSTYFIDRNGIIQDVIIGGPMSEALLRSKAELLTGSE